MFVPWPEIKNFHTARRTFADFPDLLPGGTRVVRYKGKIKIHGTNGGVRFCAGWSRGRPEPYPGHHPHQ